MPQLTVKQVIGATLAKICRDATNKVRPKPDTTERKFSQDQVNAIHTLLKSMGWSPERATTQMAVYEILLGAPELKVPTNLPLELFCVVVLDSDAGGHSYPLRWPLIITNVSNRTCLHTDGGSHWAFNIADKPRLATDEEIKVCIEELTDSQWRTIHTHDIFKPVMEAAMAQAVSVDIEPVTSKDSEEHILPDGRKITVDA